RRPDRAPTVDGKIKFHEQIPWEEWPCDFFRFARVTDHLHVARQVYVIALTAKMAERLELLARMCVYSVPMRPGRVHFCVLFLEGADARSARATRFASTEGR